MRIVSRAGTALVAIAVTVTLASCAQSGTDASDRSGSRAANTFTYAIDEDPISLNPVMADEHTDPVTEMVFRGLVGHDEANRVVPALASSWTVSPDQRTYTFTVRDGVTWHDGAPFSSADVKFTLDAVRAPGSEAATRAYFTDVTSVEAPDARTVVVTLGVPDAALLDALAMGILPEHLLAGRRSPIRNSANGRWGPGRSG